MIQFIVNDLNQCFLCKLLELLVKMKLQCFPISWCSGGPRISQRGCQPLRGRQPIILANFSQQLHENEEISAQGGVHRAPQDPTMWWICLSSCIQLEPRLP